jgi:hypothetical protein
MGKTWRVCAILLQLDRAHIRNCCSCFATTTRMRCMLCHLSSHGSTHLGLTCNARKLHDHRTTKNWVTRVSNAARARQGLVPRRSRLRSPPRWKTRHFIPVASAPVVQRIDFLQVGRCNAPMPCGWEQQRRPRATMGRSRSLYNADLADVFGRHGDQAADGAGGKIVDENWLRSLSAIVLAIVWTKNARSTSMVCTKRGCILQRHRVHSTCAIAGGPRYGMDAVLVRDKRQQAFAPYHRAKRPDAPAQIIALQ